MHKMIKTLILCFMIINMQMIFATPILPDSTKLTPPNASAMIYTTAYVNLQLTTLSNISGCAVPPGDKTKGDLQTNYCGSSPQPNNISPLAPPQNCVNYQGASIGTWTQGYVTCPANSVSPTSFSFNSDQWHTVACAGGSYTNNGITLTSVSGVGTEIQGLTCLVTIQLWVPVAALQQGGATTLFGIPAYVSNYGSIPLIQPSKGASFQATFTYNYSNPSMSTWSGPDAALMQKIIPTSAFTLQTSYFAGCGCGSLPYTGCGKPGSSYC